MSDIVIKAENLGKKYVIGHQAENDRYMTLRDVMMQNARNCWNKTKNLVNGTPIIQGDTMEEVWALKDVSFEIHSGEAVGIIGRNGAGKSTLLKILSRITEPSTGRVTIKGRVASLLEVGTGFHPELSGRENIYLNGTILGMTRVEIKRKFDEIVAFAEVEKYLDTPVKRYSSGMYVRLAFAVAAHLEPEILVVDEVLAVGDAQFQKKCIGKMAEVGKEGRTVLFVSHHMPSIQRLCSQAILLANGCIQALGETETIVTSYLSSAALVVSSSADLTCLPKNRRRGNGAARFTQIDLFNSKGQRTHELRQSEPMIVRIEIEAEKRIDQVLFGFSFISADGIEIMGTTAHDGGGPNSLDGGKQIFDCEIRPMILCPGRYFIRAAIFTRNELFDHIDELISFEVVSAAYVLSSVPENHMVGYVYVPYKWHKSS